MLTACVVSLIAYYTSSMPMLKQSSATIDAYLTEAKNSGQNNREAMY
jgi:hypothetical protein